MSALERIQTLAGRMIRPTRYSPEVTQMRERGVVNIIAGMYSDERVLAATGAQILEFRRGEDALRNSVVTLRNSGLEASVPVLGPVTRRLMARLEDPYYGFGMQVNETLSRLPRGRRDWAREEALKTARERIVARLSGEDVSDEYQAGAGRALIEIDRQIAELKLGVDRL